MKKILSSMIVSAIVIGSCKDDDPAQPAGNTPAEDEFAMQFSQSWVDTAGNPKTYFFGDTDSTGRFTGQETDGGSLNFLTGSTRNFNISFTVIKSQFSDYVDYRGTFTDTAASHMRLRLTSVIDTLYLKPQ